MATKYSQSAIALRDGLGQVPTPFLGTGRWRPALGDNW